MTPIPNLRVSLVGICVWTQVSNGSSWGSDGKMLPLQLPEFPPPQEQGESDSLLRIFLLTDSLLRIFLVDPRSENDGKMILIIDLIYLAVWQLLNHPPECIVHQTVSHLPVFCPIDFFECTRFQASAPFEFNFTS